MLGVETRRRSGFANLGDRPTGERARDLDDVLLRIATVDAECVQLEQLAGVVLVEAARGAEVVVEVVQHRRAVRDRAEQVAEFAERVGANDVAIPHERALRATASCR